MNDITHYAFRTDAQLLQMIRAQQDIQKRNPPSSREWKAASDALKGHFAEMQRRYPAGTVGPAV